MGEALISRRGGGDGDLELVLHGTYLGQTATITQALSAGRYLLVAHHTCGSFTYTGYGDTSYLSTVVFKTDGANSVTIEGQYKGIKQYYTSGGSAKTQTVDSTTTTEISCSMSSGTLTAKWTSDATSNYYLDWFGHVYLLYRVK